MNRMVALAQATALALLAACQGLPPAGPDSPYYLVPAGSRLILNQPLTIPPGELATYVQGGRVMSSSEIDVYRPHCKFELRTLNESARTVEPDEFLVTGSNWHVAGDSRSGREQYARLTRVSGDPSYYIYSTLMNLGSERQPEVFRLTCSHWELTGPRWPRHLTLQEIRGALGNVLTLRLPGDTGAG